MSMGRVLVAMVCLFVLLHGLAAGLYPGGTWFHRGAEGYDLWLNFLCDVTQPTALNGAPNALGARLGVASFAALCGALGALWWHLAGVITPVAPRRGRWLAWVGTVGCLALVAVPLTPSLRFGHLHAAVVLVAVTASLAALVMAVAAIARHLGSHRVLRAMGDALVLLVTLDAVLYAVSLPRWGVMLTALPMVQKLATLLGLGWMLCLARLAPLSAPRSETA